MKERVVVAMSGGVDSSVAAALLKEQGYEVIGITMCFSAYGGNLPQAYGRKKPACCSIEGIEDARRVAHKLGLRHYVLNMQGLLNKYVIKNFIGEYLKGRTPNPCVRCNQYLKFGALLDKARSLGAHYLATGHYARVEGRLLKKGKDKFKDQSYFLYRLNQNQLRHIIFPLGDYTKEEVRGLAREFKLPVAEKIASQEICFLPQDDYRVFLRSCAGKGIKPGSVVDKNGQVLGRHRGIAFYTIGQRQGLGVAMGRPVYITKIEPAACRITIGGKGDILKRLFLVRQVHFIANPLKNKIVVKARIRYNHKEVSAELTPYGRQLKVRFKKPQFAITPGQSAVFYDKDVVLGGGIISEVLD